MAPPKRTNGWKDKLIFEKFKNIEKKLDEFGESVCRKIDGVGSQVDAVKKDVKDILETKLPEMHGRVTALEVRCSIYGRLGGGAGSLLVKWFVGP